MILDPEQKNAFDTLLKRRSNEQLQTLGGYAGTGKTVLVGKLSERLSSWLPVAYTGKAADVMRRRGVSRASTIHSAIYSADEDEYGVTVYRRKSRNEIGGEGFLIEEASMVSAEILDDIRSYGLPIIAVGDHGQLPPVGKDAKLMADPQIRLETIHRNAGPIARFAEHLRKGGSARDWPSCSRGSANGGVWVVDKRDITGEQLTRADQIICAYNKTRVGLNRRVRELLGRDPSRPQVGDRVMCLRNDYSMNVFNGQQGVIAAINYEKNEILFRTDYSGEGWVPFMPESWDGGEIPKQEKNERKRIPFDYANAATTHKMQGDECGKLIVFEERCDKLWEHSRWAYTAASRARTHLIYGVGR